MRKIFITLVTLLCISCTAFLMTACEEDLSNPEQPKNEIQLVYDQYVSFSNENGYTPLSYEEWLATIKGEKGDRGVSIESVTIDNDGNLLITFSDHSKQTVEMPNYGGVIQHVHSYGSWITNNLMYNSCAKKYYRTCSECGIVEIKAEPDSNHSWATEYTTNVDVHAIPCTKCYEVKNVEKHNFNGGTKCTVCDYECPHVEGLIYDASHHWVGRTCSHLESDSPLYNKVKHNFNGGTKCTGCDYECSHYQYESDNTHHWIVDTCEHVANGEYSTEKQEHVFENNNFEYCVVCKRNIVLLKTTLSVVSYDGGWGVEWLQSMADEFEEMYKDYSFELDRLGIEIVVKPGKSDVTGDGLKGLMAANTDYDIFFSTFSLREYIGEGRLLNISDLVANTMDAKYKKVWSDLGETKTIAQKMDSTIKDYVLYANADGNGVVQQEAYFGIPMYSSFYNLNYDIDLFYEKGFYMDANKNFITGTKMGNTEEAIDAAKHAGQDGVKGTEDDGLPITWDDFAKMCTYMRQSGVMPMCWSGNLDSYRAGYLTNFWANYEGADDWYINVTGEGNDSQFGQISPALENGYKLAGQKGRLAALKFAENIVYNNWYDTTASTGTNHTQAQTQFLMSKIYNMMNGSDRIAMLVEGSWWENEAKSTLENLASKYGISNRRFGIMTYPRMDDGHYVDANGNNEMALVSVTPDANVAIKKNPKQKEAAELFLIFTSTEANMRKYTRMTGSTRCYDYDLTEDDYKEMSAYKVSLWKTYKRALDSGNIRYISGPSRFAQINNRCVLNNFGVTITDFGYAARDGFGLFIEAKNNTGLTAEQYFQAYQNYYTQAKYKTTFLDRL